MAKASEVPGNAGQLNGALRAGIENLSLNQKVTFSKYTRTVLPIDGYVFWTPTNQSVTTKGSLHYAVDYTQDLEEAIGFATVTFTSESQILDFTTLNANTLFVANIDGFRYAFTKQGKFYAPANVWHYVGHSVIPALASQLLDPGNNIDLARAVVSNSLPFWLDLNSYVPVYPGLQTGITLYPSYLAKENLPAPYGIVDIKPGKAIQSIPLRGPFGAHTQLVKDTVTITLYGLQNNECLDFQDAVNQYSLDTDNFGLMNDPVMSDAKRPQSDIGAIAMKKIIDYEISYYQERSTALSFQLINSAATTFYFRNLVT